MICSIKKARGVKLPLPRKLGEGSYAEVYETLTYASRALDDLFAVKIQPIHGTTVYNNSEQKTIPEVRRLPLSHLRRSDRLFPCRYYPKFG